MPATASRITGELQTVLTAAAFAPVNDRAFLRITGPDATRWLNGMVTNSIQALGPGEGCYNFLLNSQGRIQADCTIYREPEAGEPEFVLESDPVQLPTIQELLDRFIIMDDVELTLLDYSRHGVLLIGPDASRLLMEVDDPFLGTSHAQLGPLRLAYYDRTSEQITSPSPGAVPRVYITMTTGGLLDLFSAELLEAGALQVSQEALEQLRILEARPRYGTDIRNTDTAKDLPQETNQAHALHFAKGCYVGQEIVERIRSRGQVHRLLTPFRLEGEAPTTFPVPLTANGKPAGELTSAAPIPTTDGPVWLALGYARREFLDTGAIFSYQGGIATPRPAGQLGPTPA